MWVPRANATMSAFVLTMALSATVWAQRPVPAPHPVPRPSASKIDRTPSPLTPVETVWGLALNNTLTLPPAYEGRLAFIPIEGDRLVAYDLISGTQKWMVDRASRAGAGRRGTASCSSAKPTRCGRSTRATDRSPGNCRCPTSWPSNRSGTTAGSSSRSVSGEVRALRATDGEVDLEPRSEVARARRAGAGRRSRLRPDHRRPHRRAARRERRTGLGASSRRRTERDPRARRAALRRSRRTTGSTA